MSGESKKFNFVIAGRDRYYEHAMFKDMKPGQSLAEILMWIDQYAPERSLYEFVVPDANALITFGNQPVRTSVARRIFHFEWFNRAHQERQAAIQTKKSE